jgi:hypothetical protein
MPRKKKTPLFPKIPMDFQIGQHVVLNRGNIRWRVIGFNEFTGIYTLLSPEGKRFSCYHTRLNPVKAWPAAGKPEQIIETPNGIEKETGKSMAQSPKFQKGQYVTRVVESNSGRVDGYIWKVDWYNPVANNIRLLPTDDNLEPWVGWAGPEGTYFKVCSPAKYQGVEHFPPVKDMALPDFASPFPDAPLSGFANGEVTAGDLVASPEYQDKIKKIVEYLDRDYEARQAEKIAKDAVDLVESKPSLGEMLKQPAQVMVDGLLVSADTLPYHLIPPVALRELCKRIRLGEEIKGKDAWNALSDNQQVLDSRKALAHRLGHLISHAYGLLEKIQAGEKWSRDDLGEAAAVMWGGMYAICAIDRQRSPEKL